MDLGPRGTFYALLVGRNETTGQPEQGRDPSILFLQTLAPHLWGHPVSRRQTIYELMFLNAKAEVPAKLIPFLVRYRDEKDPKTVEAVDPGNLAASFGEGVRLKRVTIETTRESVTTGLEKRLPWLGTFPEPPLNSEGGGGPANAAPLNRRLTHGHFWRNQQ